MQAVLAPGASVVVGYWWNGLPPGRSFALHHGSDLLAQLGMVAIAPKAGRPSRHN